MSALQLRPHPPFLLSCSRRAFVSACAFFSRSTFWLCVPTPSCCALIDDRMRAYDTGEEKATDAAKPIRHIEAIIRIFMFQATVAQANEILDMIAMTTTVIAGPFQSPSPLTYSTFKFVSATKPAIPAIAARTKRLDFKNIEQSPFMWKKRDCTMQSRLLILRSLYIC